MWETVTYTREVTINYVENIDRILDEAESRADTADEVMDLLERMGCTITQDVDQYPATAEVEIVGYVEIQE